MTSEFNFPLWLQTLKQSYADQLQQQGFPTRKHEGFRYVDDALLANLSLQASEVMENSSLAPNKPNLDKLIASHRLKTSESILVVFINGKFSPLYSTLSSLPEGMVVSTIKVAIETHPELIKHIYSNTFDTKKIPYASLNMSKFSDGLFLSLAKNTIVKKPIHFLYFADELNTISHPHQLIYLDEGANASILSEHFSNTEQAYFSNYLSLISLKQQAKLAYYKVQKENEHAIHFSHTVTYQEKDSQFYQVNLTQGGRFSRDETIAVLKQPGSAYSTTGLYLTNWDHQIMDHHIEVKHLASHTRSDMCYKGILDYQSKAIFNGRVYIDQAAKKIVALQENHNLVLSDHAEIYTKPELEIYSDDVKCQHGATVGQLDEAIFFYMRSRGIPFELAKKMVLKGFASEILQKIEHEAIRAHLQAEEVS